MPHTGRAANNTFLLRVSGRVVYLDGETMIIQFPNKNRSTFRLDANAEVTTEQFAPMGLFYLKAGDSIIVSYREEANDQKVAKMIHALNS